MWHCINCKLFLECKDWPVINNHERTPTTPYYKLFCTYNICLPVHVHICPLLSLEVTISTLEMTSTVDGLPVGVIWMAPSHDHVIVATGFSPCMVHVRVTFLPSIIGTTGVCVIVGDVVGLSKTDWNLYQNKSVMAKLHIIC